MSDAKLFQLCGKHSDCNECLSECDNVNEKRNISWLENERRLDEINRKIKQEENSNIIENYDISYSDEITVDMKYNGILIMEHKYPRYYIFDEKLNFKPTFMHNVKVKCYEYLKKYNNEVDKHNFKICVLDKSFEFKFKKTIVVDFEIDE